MTDRWATLRSDRDEPGAARPAWGRPRPDPGALARQPAGTDRGSTDLVILTGMSGAGRSTAANVLEDLGWYVVDNLPPQLHPDRWPSCAEHAAAGGADELAAVVDVREPRFFTDPVRRGAARRCGDAGWRGPPVLVFVDATDEALVRRFESVRRPHPLQGSGRLLDGITRRARAARATCAPTPTCVDRHLRPQRPPAVGQGHPDLRRRRPGRGCASP